MIPFLLAVAAAQSQASDPLPDKTNPGSLYGPQVRSMFEDRTARRKGDILTVIIDETSVANYVARTNASKADGSQIGVNFFMNFLNDIFKPLRSGINSTSVVDGQGQTQAQSRMSFRMSVLVKEVMPNGSLVIEGGRTLVTNKETQSFMLSGIVRPIDVTADNSIRSAQIAEAEIKMTGKGMINDRQRKGILTTLIDWIF